MRTRVSILVASCAGECGQVRACMRARVRACVRTVPRSVCVFVCALHAPHGRYLWEVGINWIQFLLGQGGDEGAVMFIKGLALHDQKHRKGEN